MWVFTNTAFVSAVAHREAPDKLMVRARLKGDFDAFFGGTVPKPEVIETPDADYRFRAVVSRAAFERAVSVAAQAIDYPNFKGSIAHADDARHDAYMDVWSAMYKVQGQA